MLALSSQLSGFRVDGWKPALVAAVVFGVVNTILKPILKLLTFPITLVTLGLWLIVVNAAMLWLTQRLVKGFEISSIPSLLIGSVLLSMVGMFWKAVTKDDDHSRSDRSDQKRRH